MVTVIPGSDTVSKSFSSSLASPLGAKLCEPTFKTFPDGEVYVRLPGTASLAFTTRVSQAALCVTLASKVRAFCAGL